MRTDVACLRRIIIEVMAARRVSPNAEVYCDMDGVLVDFNAGASELLDRLMSGDVNAPWAKMPKILKRIRQAREELTGSATVVDRETMGRAVKNLMFDVVGHHPEEFFANLPPLPDGVKELWSFLHGSGHPVHILSAPIKRRSAAIGGSAGDGKRTWIEANLSPQPVSVNIVPASEKHRFAVQRDGTSNVLIDDKPSNVSDWDEAGGIGVLHVPGGGSSTIVRLNDLGL